MYKETIICIFIIILIIGLDIITQNYTKKSTIEITDCLSELKDEIENENLENAKLKIEELDNKWDNRHDKLAYYIEHDELEKVETNFTACKSLAKTEEYEQAISELEKTVYVLEHITDKYSFDLVNIF